MDPLLIHTIMGAIMFEQPIFTIFDIKQTLKCILFFIFFVPNFTKSCKIDPVVV